jgi:hypothetical protein
MTTADLQHYETEELTIDAVKANVYMMIFFIPAVVLMTTPYYFLWPEQFTQQSLGALYQQFTTYRVLVYAGVFVVMLTGVVLHELIHGITWARYTKNGFKSIRFGILWHVMTPYCHCEEPLRIRHYIIGGLMPAIVLGAIPFILALVTGSMILLCFGIFFTIAAGGDFMIVNLLRKEPMSAYIQDHPSKIGCFIYRKNLPATHSR